MIDATVQELLEEGISAGAFTCAACAVSWPGQPRRCWFAGKPDPDEDTPTGPDTLFDLASLTKPICTAVTLLRLCERGKLSLRDPVAEWLPEAPHLRDASVFHLATHTSGLPAWKPLYEAPDPAREVFRVPLERLPGLGYAYSDIGYMLLGKLLERAGGAPLGELAAEHVFAGLGMERTAFAATPAKGAAVTANCPWRVGKVLRGEVHDANAKALGGVSGHAGLFAPLDDVMLFAASLLPGARRPALDSPGALEALLRNQIGELGRQSVGLFTHGNTLLPDAGILGHAAVGHSGFTGVALLANPEHGPASALLTNRVYCDPDGATYRRFRRRIFSALAASRP
jgi:CubicO group peptidase (beta-lactamase class C family)